MATVNDIGVPGQPATNLTAWQAAVRDAVNAAAITVANWTPAAGWQDAAAPHTGLHATRTGRNVTLTGRPTPTATVPITAGTPFTIGTAPVGFRPPNTVTGVALVYSSANSYAAPYLAAVEIAADGVVKVTPGAGTTGNIGAGIPCVINLAYRAA